jgi:hypothetical protein
MAEMITADFISKRLSVYCPYSYNISYFHKIDKNEMGRVCSAYVGKGEEYTGFWWGNLKGRVHLGDQGVYGRTILRWIIRKWDVGVWTG